MANVPADLPVDKLDEKDLFLSTLPAGLAQKRAALVVVLILIVAFVIAAGPLSAVRLPRIEAFVPAYAVAMFLNDSVTAALLFGQFLILRSRALIVIACGYLFAALMIIPWMLTFPGALPADLFGSGLQSPTSFYILRHVGFPLLVIAYALTKNADRSMLLSKNPESEAFLSVISVVVLVIAAAYFVIAEDARLPQFMVDATHPSEFLSTYLISTGLLTIVALLVLWTRWSSVLDLWLVVVLCAYVIEILLISFPVPARFTMGWYAGRIFGWIASGIVLIVFLYEITLLYARALQAVAGQRRIEQDLRKARDHLEAEVDQRRRREEEVTQLNEELGERAAELEAANKELESFYSVSHEAAQAALRRSETYLAEAQRIAHVGWWERDFSTGHVQLSDESCRIFGVQPVNLPEWHGRWLDLIHPEDRARAAEIAAAALVPGGPRYDIEYRIIRPDGSLRIVHSQGDVTWDESRRPLRQFGVMQDITELRQAEQELRASEERFRTFVDYATDGFFLLDDHSTVVDVNRQACDDLGYSREELIGKHRSDFDAGLDHASIQSLKDRIAAGGAVTFETRHRRKDGTSFPVEIRAGKFEQGGRRFLCLVRDITERKQAENELRASEERFRILVEHASDAFFLYDENGTVLDVNRQACESLGYRRDELIGMTAFDFGPDLTPVLLHRIRERLRSGKVVTYDGRHRRKDGTAFPVEVRIRPLWREGQLLAVSLDRDITDRKRAEDELRASEERFRTLVQFSFDVYWETDAQHRFIRQEFGRALADAPEAGSEMGKTRWEVPHVEPDADAWRKHRETLDAHLPFRDFELARPTPDGGRRYVSVSGLPIFDETGSFIGYRGVGRHITERKKAEVALRRSEAYLAEAQRLSNSGAFAFDATGSLYWSEELYRIWGFDPLQGIPSRAWHRVHPDDRNKFDQVVPEALRNRRDFTIEFRIVLPDGTTKHLRSIGHPSFSEAGEFIEVVGITMDVTERKRAEAEHERLRQLEADFAHLNRLSVMGELTASLAHEILHPVATARNNARAGMRFLEMSPPNLAEVMEALACVVNDADRAKDIVGRVRDHIKKTPPRMEFFDINVAIDEVLVMVRDAIEKNRVAVRTCLMKQMASVRGDRVQLQQVILNLILNAVEAMNSVEEVSRELSINTELSERSDIFIAVRDSGPGIDPENLERVFAPFYTTKTSGIGMGLSICRSIIAAHGGRLWAEANRPRGAIFQFTLPSGLENP